MWRQVFVRYLVVMALLNLAWEIAQSPLYTLWWTGSPGQIAFSIVHCTGGDVLIGLAILVLALIIAGSADWPMKAYVRVAATATALGIAYVVYSEWLNTGLRQSWTYTDLMPRIPPLGTGLTPVLQWLLLPPLAFWWAGRIRAHRLLGGPTS